MVERALALYSLDFFRIFVFSLASFEPSEEAFDALLLGPPSVVFNVILFDLRDDVYELLLLSSSKALDFKKIG